MIIYSKGAMIAIGRLGKDADFRVGGAKQSHFCSFSIAADETVAADGQKKTTWIDVDAAFELADLSRNFRKGDVVFVAGKLQQRSYTTRDGEQRTANELKAEFVLPLQKPRSVDDLAAAFPGTVQTPDPVDNAFAEYADPDAKLPWES